MNAKGGTYRTYRDEGLQCLPHEPVANHVDTIDTS